MFRLMLLLAGLGGRPAWKPGSENPFIQIVLPEKIQENTNSEEQISYIIPIDEKPHIVHLKKRYFLADHFMIYLYNQGSVSSQYSDIPALCFYHGYVEGYPHSFVTLNTCSGLRGLLQFENISYGIEPLESAVKNQHILYKLGNASNGTAILQENSRSMEKHQMDYNIFISKKSESPSPYLVPLYLEMNIVVDKGLGITYFFGGIFSPNEDRETFRRSHKDFNITGDIIQDQLRAFLYQASCIMNYDYLGSDSMIVTNKVVEMISLVNSVFNQFKVTVVLSSLELWSDKNKISTIGEVDEVLRRFAEWKQSYLTLRPHDVAYLFIYSYYPNYVGATFPGKMCVTRYSVGIVMYPKDINLEAFSVIVTQMLGLSLGISYDDPVKCHCSEAICIMNPEAMQSSGMKTFSNCSLRDYESFISNAGAKCLQNKPQMQMTPRPVCGNGIVEGNEICDCGPPDKCPSFSCCDSGTCMLKPGAECNAVMEQSCCNSSCMFIRTNDVCRSAQHPECDIPEYCNGTSGFCPPDVTIADGNMCDNNTYFCYDGACHNLDERCEKNFGAGSKNAPFACYEEIQGHTDRFGHCGKDQNNKYVFCGWRNLICGRLVCTYSKRTPISYSHEAHSVIYAFVRNTICVSVDAGTTDPLMIKSGPHCDEDRICINHICVESRMIKSQSENCAKQCSGHGVCTSEGNCHCSEGYEPPNCQQPVPGGLLLPKEKGSIMETAPTKAKKKWLLGLYIGLPVLMVAAMIVVAWNNVKTWLAKEEESLSSKSKSESSTHTYTSGSTSEDNTQPYTSRSKTQGSTETHSSTK